LFTETKGKRFALTPLGATLRTDAPASMRSFALYLVGHPVWDAWGDLEYAVETGRLPFDRIFGMPFYEYAQQDPEYLRIFGEAMTSLSGTENPEIAAAFQQIQGRAHFRTVVDVAGGFGSLLALILKKNPTLMGVLFDTMPVVARQTRPSHYGTKYCDALHHGGRRHVDSVPPGGDAYLMKYIVHNWDDEHAVRIFTNCRKAMNPNGRILVADAVIPPGLRPDWGKLLDIQMMVVVPGKERTKGEFAALFARAGLRLTRIIPTKCPLSLIEGVAKKSRA
jgi:hypothetical protein